MDDDVTTDTTTSPVAASLTRRRLVQGAAVAASLGASVTGVGTASAARRRPKGAVADAIRRAGVHLDRKVSARGAYVWSYLPDGSLSWGEMQATPTMCWIQPPGTPTVGHCMLDAFAVTGDPRLHLAARRTGRALMDSQRPEGGWNYVHDFAGPRALQQWYDTIGRHGWRLEEFQHLYDNSTFDDATTSTAAQLLLRLHLIDPQDRRLRAALDRAVAFVVRTQFRGGPADGGWPQRAPRVRNTVTEMLWPETVPDWVPDDARHGMEDGDYTGMVTFNDNVIGENIKLLLMCAMSLGRQELLAPVRRAMECVRRLQQPAPQAGWGLQHLRDGRGGRPAGAVASGRSYEPRALATHTTQTNVEQLFAYFQLTGHRMFLDGVPASLDWLESCRLTAQQVAENSLLSGRTHPTFVELDTNRGLFPHRFGSNVANGAYYYDGDHRDTLSHYSGGRSIDVDRLREEYERLMGLSDGEVARLRSSSPLTPGPRRALPRFFTLSDLSLLDLRRGVEPTYDAPTPEEVHRIIDDLGSKDHWLTPAESVTNPFRGPTPRTAYEGRAYMSTNVGDVFDTSPYDPEQPPTEPPYRPGTGPMVISTETFVSKMGRLISALA